jgi:hypothetical protein
MKNYKYIWMLPVTVFLLFTSCSDDDYLGGHATTDGAGVLMTVTAQINAQTNPTLAWQANDVIGIATSYGLYDATSRNREYVCQSDGKTFAQRAGYPIYVKGAATIVGYWPFSGTDGAEPTLALDTRDQSNVTEYLFAKAENVTPQDGGSVSLVFDYALAQLQLNFTTPASEQIKSFRLTGLAQQAAVDPYTLDMTLDAPEDLSQSGANIQSTTLKLIPQTVGADAVVPVQLVLIGTFRSYTIHMGELELKAGSVVTANVNVTDGIGSVDFIPGGSVWENSGAGGDVTSK